MDKEGLDQVRFLSKAGDGEVELFMQLFEVAARQVELLDVLQVIPAPLIPWVEVGSVTRQRLQPDLALVLGYCPRHENLH